MDALLPLFLFLGVAFILLDCHFNFSPKANLRQEIADRQGQETPDWESVLLSIPNGLHPEGVTKD